jgi:hypothetical protein
MFRGVGMVYSPPPRRPLLEVVCSECTPYHGKRRILLRPKRQIPSPASACSFCALISELFGHFVDKSQDGHLYNMSIGLTTHDLQICFCEVGYMFKYETHVHILLSSPGRSSTSSHLVLAKSLFRATEPRTPIWRLSRDLSGSPRGRRSSASNKLDRAVCL